MEWQRDSKRWCEVDECPDCRSERRDSADDDASDRSQLELAAVARLPVVPGLSGVAFCATCVQAGASFLGTVTAPPSVEEAIRSTVGVPKLELVSRETLPVM